ncbi:MAG: hypothetical protein HY815_18635 [Candidatus Riflebacteria bacterium]|nr:hypothetical protein [Candidatus Riflebacteria bacterium]
MRHRLRPRPRAADRAAGGWPGASRAGGASRSRRGVTLVEALLGLTLAFSLVGMAMAMMAKGSRFSHDLVVLETGLSNLNLVRARFQQDAASVVCLVPGTSTDDLTLRVASTMNADGTVVTSAVAYRLRGRGPEVWVERDGRTLAGPFVQGRFDRLADRSGAPLVRLSLSAAAGARGIPTSMALVLTEPPRGRLPALQNLAR